VWEFIREIEETVQGIKNLLIKPQRPSYTSSDPPNSTLSKSSKNSRKLSDIGTSDVWTSRPLEESARADVAMPPHQNDLLEGRVPEALEGGEEDNVVDRGSDEEQREVMKYLGTGDSGDPFVSQDEEDDEDIFADICKVRRSRFRF